MGAAQLVRLDPFINDVHGIISLPSRNTRGGGHIWARLQWVCAVGAGARPAQLVHGVRPTSPDGSLVALATGDADPPTRSVAHLARVRYDQPRTRMAASRRVDSVTMPWQSKSPIFLRGRHGRWVHRVCRRGTFEARRNLPLNSLSEPAMQRGCTSHRMATP